MRLHGIIALMASTVVCSSGFGQTVDDFISESVKHTASDGAEDDNFGKSVAISGDRVVVGARDENDSTGSAYIFERDETGTWTEVQKITASDGAAGDRFGFTVSISGDSVVAGALNEEVAYIFERDEVGTWTEVQKITASDGAEGDDFGNSVSISGDSVVVGAYRDDNDNVFQSGSAYLFERDGAGTWTEVQKLSASDGVTNWFGNSVSISGDRVVVGARRDNGYTGSAYIFERDGDGVWVETQKVTASDGDLSDDFGFTVSISGDNVVVGAYYDNYNGQATGSGYIFERDEAGTWTEVQKLTASDGAANDYFGASVSISGDRVVVGADGTNDNGSNSGSAYIFERDEAGTWREVKILAASDPAAYNFFGDCVSISGDSVVVGALGDNEAGVRTGSAYMLTCNRVLNLDFGNRGYLTLEGALAEVEWGERLAVRSSAFAIEGILNTSSIPLTFIAVEPIEIGAGLMFLPADGTSFTDSGDVEEAGYSLYAQLIAPEQGQLIFSSLELLSGSQFHHNESSLMVNRDLVTTGGVGYLSGDILSAEASTGIDGVNRVYGDTNLFCDYTNDGATIIQRGILYIYGDLVNNGTLTGEYNNGFTGGEAPEPGDGFNIGGSYTIGQDATLSMPNPVWWLRVSGDLDIAIDDPANFTMSEATIALNGAKQALETLSADLGAIEAGFDPSNFPIGTLRIGSDSTTQLVNNHVNSVEAECEVLYVNELFVAPGGSLLTGGCTIYAHSATIDGTVDDPASIVIVEGAPPCPADLTGDGEVNGADLGLMIAFWGTPGGDLTGDKITDGADLGLLIASWGVCPN